MTPIHGDVRTGNILTGRRRDAALMLIDWETGGSGCPWLDVGAGVAMLLEWSVVAGAGEPPSKSVTALLEGYRAIGDCAIDLRSVVQCAGLRMLQAGVEYGEDSVDIAAVARRFLRVGLILLTRPEEAAIRLGLVS
jgi:aminoglycoside phosphotransferase (APT) family kinase protein